ncbi:hypothetical protein EB001_16800 [bacterium]|nr:hypothetical protein [bacterium]
MESTISEEKLKNGISASCQSQDVKKPSKEEVFESLEKDVVLLNSMFSDLHDMVKEHGEQLDTLEDSIIATKSDVSNAHKEIVVASTFSNALTSIRTGIIGVGIGSLVYIYNPYLAIGSMIVGGYIGLSLSS